MIEKLQKILREIKGDGQIAVTPQTVLLSDLKLDSFDVAQFISEIEIQFDIKINDRDIGDLKTIQDVLDHIASKQK
jgi:acyl carrier protein